jgi:hypothetical protein
VEERVFILKRYLKTMSYFQGRQRFLEEFRRKAPVESAIAKMLLNSVKQVHFSTRIVIGRSQCWGTARYSNGYYKISSQIFAEIKCTNGYFVRFSPYCGEEDAEIVPIPNAVFS